MAINYQVSQHWNNPWFREEFDDDREDWRLVFRTQKRFNEFKYYLREELAAVPLSLVEKEYYRTHIVEFVRDIINYKKNLLSLAPKQIAYLEAMQDMDNKKFILLTPRGGSKTMLGALISVWSCSVYDRYFQTVLGGAFNQTKALSQQAGTFILDSPRLALMSTSIGIETIRFNNGSMILSLKASETSARSPHPSGLMLDEFVVMRSEIITAARGQLAETAIGFYRHGRLIITSTAQSGHSVNEFKDIFENGWRVFQQEKRPKKWNYFLSYNWRLLDCTWRTDEEMEEIQRTKESISEEEYKVEYEGEFGTLTGSIFKESNVDFITENAAEPFYEERSPIYPCHIGIDWGYSINPTVVILVQKHSDGMIRVLDMESGLKIDFDYWQDLVYDWCREYNVVSVNADSSHQGENARLAKRGVPMSSIAFGGTTTFSIAGKVGYGTFKDIMLENIRWIIGKHFIEIHPSFAKLVKEVRNYRWKEQKDNVEKKPIKKGVDHVEALQLAILNLREGAYVSTPMSAVAGNKVITANSGTYDISDKKYSQKLVGNHVVGSVIGERRRKRKRFGN